MFTISPISQSRLVTRGHYWSRVPSRNRASVARTKNERWHKEMAEPDFDDPEYWRDRAAGVRGLVDRVNGSRAKDAILRIAAEYESLAEMAEARS